MSLKTGDAKERKSLWTQKSRLSVSWVARNILTVSIQLPLPAPTLFGSGPAATPSPETSVALFPEHREKHDEGEVARLA